jgi:chromosome segregation ATPase
MLSLGSSTGLSGIVGSDYTSAQQEIEKILVRNINEIINEKGKRIDRLSEITPLVQELVDSADTAERKMRIANDKIVDLELAGVTVSDGEGSGLVSVKILHSQLQQRESDLAQAVEEIERLTEQIATAREEERNSLAVAHAERDRLAFLISGKDTRVAELEHAVKSLESKYKKSQADLVQRSKELGELRADLANVSAISQAEVEALGKEKDGTIQQLQLELDELARSVAQRQHEQSKREVELEKQLVRMRAERSANAGSIVSIQDKVEMSVLQDECARLRRKNIDMEANMQRSRNEVEVLKLRIKEVEEENERNSETKNNAIKHLEMQNNEILQKLSVLTAEKKALEKNNNEFASTVETLRSDTELLQDIVAAVRTQSEQTIGENNRLKFKLEGKEKEVARLKEIAQESVLKAAKNRLDAAEAELVSLKAEKEVLKGKLEQAERRINQLVSSLDDSVADREAMMELSESTLEAERQRISHLERKSLSLEQELLSAQFTREALEEEIKGLQGEFDKRRKNSEINVVDEVFAAVSAVRAEFGVKLKESAELLAEKEKIIEELRVNQQLLETPVVAAAVLVDDIEQESSIMSAQELQIAEAELRSLIHNAGWPLDNGAEDIGSLVSVVRANVSAIEEFYTNQMREMELDIEYLRSHLEGERMRLEDAHQTFKRHLEVEVGKRKVLQESALELAAKTTEVWNKYRSPAQQGMNLPPFSRNS